MATVEEKRITITPEKTIPSLAVLAELALYIIILRPGSAIMCSIRAAKIAKIFGYPITSLPKKEAYPGGIFACIPETPPMPCKA